MFDSIDFRKLKKRHWKVLSLIRKLSAHITITWVSGNHDGPSEFVSHLIGIDFRKEYMLQSGGSSILILHGHRFDEFIDTHPRVIFAADLLYRFLQAIDPSHRFARFAKTNSKVFLRSAKKIRNESIAYAKSQNADTVCCGHTHHAEAVTTAEVKYYNSGCWTEMPCNYLMIKDGKVTLEQFTPLQIPSTVLQTHEDNVNTVIRSFGGISPENRGLQSYGSW
jgi:UDP-2,3-diacylglucosamine pyrophosphatase LpxH